MATRTGAGTGVVVGLVVFVLSTIFLLVLTIVFYSKQEKALMAQSQAEAELDKFANRTQRNSDSFKAVLASATGAGESALQHQMNERQDIMRRVLGDPNADMAALDGAINAFAPGNPNSSMRSVLQGMSGDLRAAGTEITGLRDQISSLNQLITEKNALLEEAERARGQEVQAVRDLIATFQSDVQKYGIDVAETKRVMLGMVEQLEATYDAQVNELERQVDSVRSDLALKESQLETYQRIINESRLQAQNPAMMVDGNVLDNATSDGQVFISLGRLNHVTLGMSFEVYDDASAIRVDENGNLPRGKASIQIIKVAETTSTAKITRGSAGRPVVEHDVIANAVYDPQKQYLFLVHGKFDVNQDGRPSESETDYVRSLITDWGGRVAEGEVLRGDIDFLLLGDAPSQPMPLPDNPTPTQVEIWVKQNQAFETYNNLLRDAMKANIPVLNQNRFFILIGHTNQ